MACRLDVKKAILDDVIKRFIEGRNTFSRSDDDIITIINTATNGSSRAKRDAQALAIANNLANRIGIFYDKHVIGLVDRFSPYDPYFVRLVVSPLYIEHEYQKLPPEEKTDPADKENKTDIDRILIAAKDVRGIYAEIIQDNPMGFMKELAQQIYGLTADNKLHSEGETRAIAVKSWGIDLVLLAEKLFPYNSFVKPDELPPIEPDCK